MAGSCTPTQRVEDSLELDQDISMVSPNEALQQGLEPRVEAPAGAQPEAVAEPMPSYDKLLEKLQTLTNVEETMKRMEQTLDHCATKLAQIEERDQNDNILPREAVQMIVNNLDNWEPEAYSDCYIVRRLMQVLTLFSRMMRHKYEAQLDGSQIVKCRMLIFDESAFRVLPEPGHPDYDATFAKMMRLVEVLSRHENKWIQDPDENLSTLSCIVVTPALRELFLNPAADKEATLKKKG